MGFISKKKQRIIEGELRSKELKEYLERLRLKKCVWLCEDASGINSSIQFDSATNQMVGLVLPLHEGTGMPIPFTFLAKNSEEIMKNIQKPTSTLVYLILAQPLMEKAPPFVLQIFGTKNTFTAVNVIERWEHTKAALKK